MNWIEEIKNRLDALPPGPWEVVTHSEYYGGGYGETTYFVKTGKDLLKIGTSGDQEGCKRYHALAKFIAHAREDVPDLIHESELWKETLLEEDDRRLKEEEEKQ